MSFDPKKHVIRVQGGREYLPVAARLVWFRGEHPDWGIVTNPVEINMEKQYAIFGCSIFNADGKLMATATKMEDVRGFPDFLEKAETGSVGRALAYCGYGTQFAPELEENTRFADAPQTPANARPAPPRPAYSAPPARPAVEGGGIMRVREPERSAVDPGGPDEDQEDPFLDGEEPAPVPAPAKPNPLGANRCSVEGCSNVLTTGQMTLAINKYGRPLCLIHQKESVPIAGSPGNGRRAEAPVSEPMY